MHDLATMASCPNCGAPLPVKLSARVVLCVFCNTSLLLSASAQEGAAPVCTAQAVPTEDIERIKQLLIDGKRVEAVALYRSLAGVTLPEAEAALDAVVVDSYSRLTRHLPINGFGFLLYGVLVGGAASLSVWAACGHHDPSRRVPLLVLSVAAGAFALWQLLGFLAHLRATFICAFGATGKGRIVRQGILRAKPETDDYLVAVVIEVTPDDGGAPFVDQETVFTSAASLAKLAPHNVLRVRFDDARQHVYFQRPVTVLEVAGQGDGR